MTATLLQVEKTPSANLPAYSAFFTKCFTAEYGAIYDQETLEWIVLYAQNAAAEDILCPGAGDATALTVRIDESIVGTIVYAERHESTYIWGLYVDPDHLRAGIGTRLMRAVCESVTPDSMLCVVVMQASAKARAFYAAAGFEIYNQCDEEIFPGISAPVFFMCLRASALLEKLS